MTDETPTSTVRLRQGRQERSERTLEGRDERVREGVGSGRHPRGGPRGAGQGGVGESLGVSTEGCGRKSPETSGGETGEEGGSKSDFEGGERDLGVEYGGR